MTVLKMIGLTRKSKGEDEGTYGDQRRIIEARAKAEGFRLVRIDKEHQVSGAKGWREREIGRAILDVKAGRADGIIVAYEDRITRERMLAAAEIWTAMQEAGVVFIACDGVDSRTEDAEFMFTVKAGIARMQWSNYKKRSDDGRGRAVLDEGVHGGDTPPLGYAWTERADGSRNVSGNAKHGPLEIDPATASRVRAAYEALADEDGSWKSLVGILGVASQGAARNVLINRVYLEEARSGDKMKPNAHPVLVDEVLFNRAQRRLADRARRNRRAATNEGRVGGLLAGGILRCGTCGGPLSYDASLVKPGYRCKRLVGCSAHASIQASKIDTVALALARRWHRRAHPDYAMSRAVQPAPTSCGTRAPRPSRICAPKTRS